MKRFAIDMTEAEILEANSMPEPNSGCWLWTGSQTSNRYYGLVITRARKSRAHRAAWRIANNAEIPAGMCVCHKCDVTWCVNPDHLFLGSQADNMADRHAKGRYSLVARGEQTVHAVLTADDVREIRASAASLTSLAKKFGVNHSTVRRVRLGQSWRHV